MDYNEIEVKKDNTKKEESTEVVKPKMDAIVTKKPKAIKKGLMERLVVGVLGPDGIPAIGNYLGKEIVLPAVKNIIVDSITSGINMVMFGGESRQGGNTPTNYGGPASNHWSRPNTTNYSQNYKPKTNYTPNHPTTYAKPVERRSNRVDDYVIPDRNEAIGVLDTLNEQVVLYGSVSVADYYDMIGIEPSYTDNTYGWTTDDLAHASVVPTRGGYILKLPPVVVI